MSIQDLPLRLASPPSPELPRDKRPVTGRRFSTRKASDAGLTAYRKNSEAGPLRKISDGIYPQDKRRQSVASTFSKCSLPEDFFNTVGQGRGGRKLSMDYFCINEYRPQEEEEEALEEELLPDLEQEAVRPRSQFHISAGFEGSKLRVVLQFWRSWIIILSPLLLSPLIVIIGNSEAKCGYVILLMSVLWVTEAVPLPVSALIPVILLPFLGVMRTEEVCVTYLKESNMMFIGGLIVAIAVEHCRLHQRVALRVLLFIGTSPRLLMLGFMLPTMFLSMWISNTATTAMMVPIVEAMLEEMEREVEVEEDRDTLPTISEENELDNNANRQIPKKMEKETHEMDTDKEQGIIKKKETAAKQKRNMRLMIYLSVAYAANIGGTGTLTGTGPNLALKGMLSTLYPSTPINFASWMGFAVPIMLANLALTWLWLQLFFMGPPWRPSRLIMGDRAELRRVLRDKYEELGPMNFHQGAVLVNFIILILLWFFRDPQFIHGWGEEFTTEERDPICGTVTYSQNVDDASAAMLIVFLLFVIPSQLNFWPFTSLADSKPSPGLIDWRTIHDRFPWGVMLLFGAGFALAEASKVSHLSDWLGSELTILKQLPDYAIVIVICIMTAIVTEVTSNVATANILLPVLAEMAKATEVNPLYFMVPATVTCSFAFMLPVATPPNAIVYAASGMRTSEMMLVGSLMNILCIVTTVIAVNTYAFPMFDLDTFPDWARQPNATHC